MIKGPSKHLSWKELACKDGTPYPDEWRNNRAIDLSEVFELIRMVCGNIPIEVLSGYRTPEWNRKIGGARDSQHTQGRALDLKPPIAIDEFYRIIKDIAKVTKIRGIGKYKKFIHIDIRPTTQIAHWSGIGVKDSIRL